MPESENGRKHKFGNPVLGDAFGEALRECWAAGGAGGNTYAMIERDDGFVTVADIAEYFDEFDKLEKHEQWAVRRSKGRVLDVGCGAGRHSIAAADMGADVIGIDPSPGAVDVSRQRGVHVVKGTAKEQECDIGIFDCMLLLGYNLGLLESRQEGIQVLTALARKAKIGTRLFGNSLDPRMTPPEQVHYREGNRRQGRMPGVRRIRIRHKHLSTDWFDYLYLSPEELEELIVDTGWAITEIETEGQSYAVELTMTRANLDISHDQQTGGDLV